MRKRPLVMIEWWDTMVHRPGWLESEKIKTEAVLVQSVGWIVKRSQRAIFLAADTAPADTETNRLIEIPLGMVKGDPIPLVRKPE